MLCAGCDRRIRISPRKVLEGADYPGTASSAPGCRAPARCRIRAPAGLRAVASSSRCRSSSGRRPGRCRARARSVRRRGVPGGGRRLRPRRPSFATPESRHAVIARVAGVAGPAGCGDIACGGAEEEARMASASGAFGQTQRDPLAADGLRTDEARVTDPRPGGEDDRPAAHRWRRAWTRPPSMPELDVVGAVQRRRRNGRRQHDRGHGAGGGEIRSGSACPWESSVVGHHDADRRNVPAARGIEHGRGGDVAAGVPVHVERSSRVRSARPAISFWTRSPKSMATSRTAGAPAAGRHLHGERGPAAPRSARRGWPRG